MIVTQVSILQWAGWKIEKDEDDAALQHLPSFILIWHFSSATFPRQYSVTLTRTFCVSALAVWRPANNNTELTFALAKAEIWRQKDILENCF